MRQVPVRSTTYRNKRGKLVHRRAHRRRVPGASVGDGSPRVRNRPVRSAGEQRAITLVIVIVVLVVLGAVATVAVKVASASGGTTVNQADERPMSADTSATYFQSARSAFLAMSHGHVDLAVESGSNCEQHSYGKVADFFKSHPCQWLTRAYLAVHDGSLGEVLVALSWVGMPNASSAVEYKKLVDAGGTGNITELSRDTGPYRSVKYDGKIYKSGIDGSSVWNMEVQPVGQIPASFVSAVFDKFN
jgi:hypothetical protein